MAHSRRVVYFDDVSKRPGAVINSTHGVNGHARMYGNTNDANFSHYEAGADPFVNLLYTFDAAGRLTGAVVNVPCPVAELRGRVAALGIVLERSPGGHPREARQHLHPAAVRGRRRPVPAHPALQEGPGAPLRAQVRHRAGADQRMERPQRHRRAHRVSPSTEVLEWAKKDIRTALPVAHVVKTVHLDKRRITAEEAGYEKKQLDALLKTGFKKDGTPQERLFHDSMLVASRNRCRRILARFEEQKAEPKLPMELHVVRIGDIAFASNRFELYMDFMHRIQARSPFTQTFVVQLAGVPGPDGGTYLATERGAWGKGYSASRYCNHRLAAGRAGARRRDGQSPERHPHGSLRTIPRLSPCS